VFRPDNRTVLSYMPAAETASGTASGTTDEASHGDEETAA
jgi:hypothetical protein